ncbi:MAG TPA: GNAT family N-acetyltransferase [Chitinophagaceae bacterium]|nr:GNAT family N-acetyltransferase [Chitinophagaceae bacterium]
MIFREAQVSDIQQMQIVRHSVKENILSNPELVTDKDCEEFITVRGKGWVCEINGNVVGFSIADIKENNVWALFVHPEHEAKGIGKRLQEEMLHWYFSQTKEKIWLSTAPASRAEKFYRMNGWVEAGIHGKGEIKFEMNFEDWQDRKAGNAKNTK